MHVSLLLLLRCFSCHMWSACISGCLDHIHLLSHAFSLITPLKSILSPTLFILCLLVSSTLLSVPVHLMFQFSLLSRFSCFHCCCCVCTCVCCFYSLFSSSLLCSSLFCFLPCCNVDVSCVWWEAEFGMVDPQFLIHAWRGSWAFQFFPFFFNHSATLSHWRRCCVCVCVACFCFCVCLFLFYWFLSY